MRYLYKGVPGKGKGRKKVYDGKVSWQSIDKRRWKQFDETEEWMAYEAVLYSVVLKQKVKVVYVEQKEGRRYEILISTDTAMKGKKYWPIIVCVFRLSF